MSFLGRVGRRVGTMQVRLPSYELVAEQAQTRVVPNERETVSPVGELIPNKSQKIARFGQYLRTPHACFNALPKRSSPHTEQRISCSERASDNIILTVACFGQNRSVFCAFSFCLLAFQVQPYVSIPVLLVPTSSALHLREPPYPHHCFPVRPIQFFPNYIRASK